MTRKSAAKDAARARQREHGGKYEAHLRTVGGTTSHAKPWTCEVCKKAISAGQGYVVVMDVDSHGHPRRPSANEVEFTDVAIQERRSKGEPTEVALADSYLISEVQVPKRQIEFGAFHQDCDPYPGTSAYGIEVQRADTLEAWCGWMHHLCGTGWMGLPDIRDMIAFWFGNRGQSIHAQAG
jgi:hypothetical protein